MVSPEEIYNFAASLVQSNPDEIRCRQAAARAYYSVLLLARERTGITSTKGVSSHQSIYEELFRLRTKGLLETHFQEALNFWNTLKDMRQRADYDIRGDFKEVDAKRSVGIAKKIFDGAKQ
jgi:hypothetical protein